MQRTPSTHSLLTAKAIKSTAQSITPLWRVRLVPLFTTIQGDERTTGDTSDVTSDSGSDTLQLFGLGGAKVRTDEANDAVYIDSRAVAMAIALG